MAFPGDMLILDDSWDSKLSEAKKQALKEWYEKTLESRKQREGDIICVFSKVVQDPFKEYDY